MACSLTNLEANSNMSQLKKFRKKIKYSVIITAIDFLLFIVQVLPWKWTSIFCARLGVVSFYVLKNERTKTISNLTIAYGEEKSQDEIYLMARDVFYNLGRGVAELAIKIKNNDKGTYFSNVEIIGLEHIQKAVDRGKGIINIVPHLGCWEAAPKAFTLLGFSGGAVAKPLSNERLDDWLVKNREFSGFKVFPRGSTYKTILMFLKQNNGLAMLIDVDTSIKSVFVDFYGKPAHTPIGAAMLALDSDAAVFTSSYIRTEGNNFKLICSEPFEIIRTGDRKEELQLNTALFHKAVEDQIKAYPTQWVWMHERWKTTPEMVEAREREKQDLRRKRREEKAK